MKKRSVLICMLCIVIIFAGMYLFHRKAQETLFFESHQNNDGLVEQSKYIYQNKGRRISKILDSLGIKYKEQNWSHSIEAMYIRTNEGTFTFKLKDSKELGIVYDVSEDIYISLWLEKDDKVSIGTKASRILSEKEIEDCHQIMLNEYRKLLNEIYQNQ
ncbi:hypothetical protein [Listeria booriae]|uniref:hypothetical protein n=1 Tax=Listeria booriae TaxID=1552123 RepID=UPI001624815B|nr:hypothetical protein [Listeria booriae]MBC2149779.1 hypothetical protein [Listeria booriae]